MIGARVDVIKKAEDRELFREAMKRIGLRVPASGIARTMPEVLKPSWARSAFPSSSARPSP